MGFLAALARWDFGRKQNLGSRDMIALRRATSRGGLLRSFAVLFVLVELNNLSQLHEVTRKAFVRHGLEYRPVLLIDQLEDGFISYAGFPGEVKTGYAKNPSRASLALDEPLSGDTFLA